MCCLRKRVNGSVSFVASAGYKAGLEKRTESLYKGQTHFYGKTAELEIVWVAKPFVPGI